MHRSIWSLGMLTAVAVVLFGVVAGQTAPQSPPDLVFEPSYDGAYDFGTVTVGQTVSQEFMLTNIGGSSTSSLSFMLSDELAGFMIAEVDDCTNEALPPDMTCLFTVTYSPTEAGVTDFATLTVTGKNAFVSASLELSGTGAIRRIYWAETNANQIGRADLPDGANDDRNFIMANDPVGVAVDANFIYWANSQPSSIGRAELDENGDVVPGTENEQFIIGPSVSDPQGVAVNANFIFWANFKTNTIGRADLPDGGNQMVLPITDAQSPTGIAADDSHVYWVNSTADTISRADLDGGNEISIFIETLSIPLGVAVDDSHIYWANRSGKTIGRADLDENGDVVPGSVNQSFITDVDKPQGVAVDATSVYWATLNNVIGRADLDGGNPDRDFLSLGGGLRGVAVDPD
jgi:hypothetical protein